MAATKSKMEAILHMAEELSSAKSMMYGMMNAFKEEHCAALKKKDEEINALKDDIRALKCSADQSKVFATDLFTADVEWHIIF